MNNKIKIFLVFVSGINVINSYKQEKLLLTDNCRVTKFDNVENATKHCQHIIISDLFVPAGQTLSLNLLDGATLTFRGNNTFGHVNWAGPLIKVVGNGITVQGDKGNIDVANDLFS